MIDIQAALDQEHTDNVLLRAELTMEKNAHRQTREAIANLILAAQQAMDAIDEWGLRIPTRVQVLRPDANEAEILFALKDALTPFVKVAKTIQADE